MKRLTESPAWNALCNHETEIRGTHLRELFARDPARFDRFSLKLDSLLLDYSKNRITAQTMSLLMALARERDVESLRDAMLRGDPINLTEDRAVLHTALRRPSTQPLHVNGRDIMPEVVSQRRHMREFSDKVRKGEWHGHTGRAITDVVNIGIGGSDLGPAMACEALSHYASPDLRVHFVSNLDASHFNRVAERLNAETTLFIIASKTFTTLETMTNAHTARRWFMAQAADEAAIRRHFVALSTNTDRVREFGIDIDNMFQFWDWVGGRYSLWSVIGLPLAISVGMDRFEEMLAGAHFMDTHFAEAPLERNMPAIMALLGIWNHNFLDSRSHAVIAYEQNLSRFAAHLQQVDMESNGKRVDRQGRDIVDYGTGPIVWGEPGCNSQHSFFQLLHQGTQIVPVDFLVAARSAYPTGEHHRLLVASCLAQSEALMRGRTEQEARDVLESGMLDEETMALRLPHCVFPGNRPSNTLAYQELDPYTLGMLIALYEHKVFVQGAIWNVNSFDQWGVELGKQLTGSIAIELRDGARRNAHDSSTNGLIDHLRAAGEFHASRVDSE